MAGLFVVVFDAVDVVFLPGSVEIFLVSVGVPVLDALAAVFEFEAVVSAADFAGLSIPAAVLDVRSFLFVVLVESHSEMHAAAGQCTHVPVDDVALGPFAAAH